PEPGATGVAGLLAGQRLNVRPALHGRNVEKEPRSREVDMPEQITVTEEMVQTGREQGCEECNKTGGRWVSLRMCLNCGKVGCCDSSPGKHATQHWQEVGHNMM